MGIWVSTFAAILAFTSSGDNVDSISYCSNGRYNNVIIPLFIACYVAGLVEVPIILRVMYFQLSQLNDFLIDIYLANIFINKPSHPFFIAVFIIIMSSCMLGIGNNIYRFFADAFFI